MAGAQDRAPTGPLTVLLFGEPVPFARTGHNGGQHFTPKKQRNAAAALRIAAQQEMGGRVPFDEPVRMYLTAEFSIPTSWSKKKQSAALLGELHPGKRPDIDNLYKLAADALNTVAYRDDALIVEAHLSKRYGAQPKLVVTIEPFWGVRRSVLALTETAP